MSFIIDDTAADISAGLRSPIAAYNLNDDNIASIVVEDNNPIGVDVTEITEDAGALVKTTNANSSLYQLAITDTSDDVTNALSELENDNRHISSITLSSGVVNLSYDDYLADRASSPSLPMASGLPIRFATIVKHLKALDADAGIVALLGDSGAATLTHGSIKAGSFGLGGNGTALTLAENLSYSGELSLGSRDHAFRFEPATS